MSIVKTNRLDLNLIKSHIYNALLMPTKIILCARRTVALIINDAGELIVRAPKNCTEKSIYNFINQKANWIIKKRSEMLNNNMPPLKLDGSNETISLLGNVYKIVLADYNRVKISEDCVLVPRINSIEKLKSFLIKQSKSYISKRTQEIAQTFDLKYKSVSIRSSTTRWGSCGYKNSLNFTYKLIMCPPKVIDYIIIHELSHTIEKNHSRKFYNLVASMMPDYEVAEKWLKTNKSIIHVI